MRLLSKAFLLPVSFAAVLSSSVLANTPQSKVPAANSFSGAFLAGRVAGSDMKLDIAANYFKQAYRFDPKNVQIQKDTFLTLLSIGSFDESVSLAQKLKNEKDIALFARLTLSMDAMKQRNFSNARKYLAMSGSVVVERLPLRILDAWASFGMGNRQSAVQNTKELIGPDWLISYQTGLLYELYGKRDEALKYYARAFSNKQTAINTPDIYERVVIAYASLLQRSNQNDQAVLVLKEGEKSLFGRYVLQNLRKMVEQGGTIEAPVSSSLQGASELLYDLATMINNNGSEPYARLYLQLSLAGRPGHDATLYQLADIAAKLNEHERAIALFKEIPASSPYADDAKLRMALSFADLENNDQAISYLAELEKKYPNDLRTTMSLATLYMHVENYADAAKVFEHAIARIQTPQTSDWLLYYQRGVCYERLKEWDKAEPDFRKSLELAPNQPQVLNYLGYSLIDRNEKLDEALDLIMQAVRLAPRDGYIIDSLGWAYYMLGRYDEAVRELEKAVMLRPEDPAINDHLGDAYWQVGRKLEATFQWNHALSGKPDEKDVAKIEAKLKNGLSVENNHQATKDKVENTVKAEPSGKTEDALKPVAPAAPQDQQK